MNTKKLRSMIKAHSVHREKISEAKRYYENENLIKKSGIVPVDKDPLRNADNRISHNFHQLLVDEKAAYMFTYPVMFDLDNDEKLNKDIKRVLGDEFESVSKELCIEASNCGLSWLHYWINDKTYEYALVPTEQIIAIYSSNLKREVKEVYRYYEINEEGNKFTVVEHWTDKTMDTYKIKGGIEDSEYKLIEEINIIHELDNVPFISFKNNINTKSDLDKYKDLINIYDNVMSGFANDLEDIQQVIYILENYGGEGLKEFLGDLKRYKAIKTESGAGAENGGVKTLQIEIPVEARKIILEILKKQIYESGQGLQQDIESAGNASGVALKFFYRKLELKSGNLETEFKKSFNKFIRSILKYLKSDKDPNITQTYTRNMISNEFEISQIAQQSIGVIPRKLILKNHPWVEDAEAAEKMLEEELYDQYEGIGKEVVVNEQ